MSQPDHASSLPPDDTLAWGDGSGTRDLSGVTLGDFHVDRLLGKGGMGEVYLARQTSLNNREVALKVLRPDLLRNPTYLSRFEAEAWSAAKLNHPNIVHIYSVGSFDGVRYIAMEYVQGTNLRDYIIKKGPPEMNLALSIMRQATAAVGAAGELGLIHRDIKPENMLITRKGLVKVADFGLCRDQDRSGGHLTQDGVTMGTPLYMSPEQAQGHPLDHRSDLYSLGVSFYHMLAGVPPFKAESPVALALKHVKDIPPTLSIHRPDILPELERLVMKLMSKKPADRYQSAAEVLKDLSRVREAYQLASTQVGKGVDVSLTSQPAAVVPTPERSPGKPATAPARAPGPSLKERLSGLNVFSRRVAIGVLLVATASGLLSGAMARPKDLLGPNSPPGEKRVILWLAPDWKAIPKQASAAAQYRYAQTKASTGERDAAWIAVIGNFPGASSWVEGASTQLARELFRQGDVRRISILRGELERTGRGHDVMLTKVLKAAEDILRNHDLDGVNVVFDQGFVNQFVDSRQVELALEIVSRSVQDARTAGKPAVLANRLRAVQGQLFQKLIDIRRLDGLAPN